jgi:hypothetical protein
MFAGVVNYLAAKKGLFLPSQWHNFFGMVVSSSQYGSLSDVYGMACDDESDGKIADD